MKTVYLEGDDRVPFQNVLDGALSNGVVQGYVIGRLADGTWYYAASDPDVTKAIYAADRFINFLHNIDYRYE